ncbi:uncharacterized protein LOC116844051 isoform X4 [Odontomachus brunneus]|uniref:uncharacterized protein LOC116844051 isoform X4 n=1 Tax=Odontomachus brunneus TaxID=486640 RepID=UPI0013F1F091|nr:uncharacterized protein LOC116844051 isoform X4 [Odontomachus brunneus]
MTSYDLTTMTEVHPAVISEGDLIQIQFNSSTIWQTHEKIVNIFSMPFNIHHYITSIQKESCYLCQRTELHTLLRRRLCARHISNHALSLHIDMYYMFEEELPSVDKYFNPNTESQGDLRSFAKRFKESPTILAHIWTNLGEMGTDEKTVYVFGKARVAT